MTAGANGRSGPAARVAAVSLAANVILMAAKLAAGHYGNSAAVFADGIESASDLVAVLFSIVALRIASRPLDEKHPYGHGRAEYLSALLGSFLIAAAGGAILVQGVKAIFSSAPSPEPVALAVAAGTVISKEALYRYTIRVARFLGSPTLLAMAQDHRKDAVTSIATVAGVGGAASGIHWMDPAAAVVTSLFIFRIAYGIFTAAAHDIMDATAPCELVEEVARVAEGVTGVEHARNIRGRRYGQYVIIDMELDMDPQMTVRDSHDLGDEVRRRVLDAFPTVADVMIHVNPHLD